MVQVVQVNLIVSRIDASRDFYEKLGLAFRARSRTGDGPAEAWVSTNTGVTIVLHSPEFAAWWDASAPVRSAGTTQVDLRLASVDVLQAAVDELGTTGTTIVKPPTDMPWGDRLAIVLDPDGNRVGLKAVPG